MMTAPPTMMPKSIAPMDNNPIGIFAQNISTSANSRENGIVTATSAARRGLPKKKNNTSTTRPMPMPTLWATVSNVVVISTPRS